MRGHSRFPFSATAGTIVALSLVAGSLAGCGSGLKEGAASRRGNAASNAGVFLPSSQPFGKTYGEWAAEWWKWAWLIPASDNPFLDTTGEKCHVGQSGPVWFLGSTLTGFAERRCVVPADKALFFPVGLAVMTWIPLDADTVEGLRAVAKVQVDHFTELEVVVDGLALQGLHSFRFRSPSSFFYQTTDVYGFLGLSGPAFQDGVPYEAVTDGYWVMLEPLSVGEHTIRSHIKVVFPAQFPDVQVSEFTVIWHLTVQ